MPVQASAVPCERVFSSSKETDVLRRSKTSPLTMEVLQVLKYLYRSERIPFTARFLATEADLDEEGVEPGQINNLLTESVEEIASFFDTPSVYRED